MFFVFFFLELKQHTEIAQRLWSPDLSLKPFDTRESSVLESVTAQRLMAGVMGENEPDENNQRVARALLLISPSTTTVGGPAPLYAALRVWLMGRQNLHSWKWLAGQQGGGGYSQLRVVCYTHFVAEYIDNALRDRNSLSHSLTPVPDYGFLGLPPATTHTTSIFTPLSSLIIKRLVKTK